MLITNNPNWLHTEGARLGVQTNLDCVVNDAHMKAHGWRPAKAQSYSICFEHIAEGDSTIFVRYYTRRNEGLTVIDHSQYKLRYNG